MHFNIIIPQISPGFYGKFEKEKGRRLRKASPFS